MTSKSSDVSVHIVSEVFYPDAAATGQLLWELAQGLRKMACRVTVWTTYSRRRNYGDAREADVPDGIMIHRAPSTAFDKDVLVGRLSNTVTFLCSVFAHLLVGARRGPLLIVSNPPLLPLLGYLLNVVRRQPYVVLIHDVFPDAAIHLGYLRADGWLRRAWDAVNCRVYGRASRIIVIGESMRHSIAQRMASPADAGTKITVIHNWADGNFIRPIDKGDNPFVTAHDLHDKFVVMYSGNMGLGHDLESVVQAAEMLKDRAVVFLFIGEGGKKPKLQDLVARRGLSNVRFLPYQPREMFPFSAASADVSVIAMEKGIEGVSMPSKLYTILASGRPVVALLEGGDVADLIEVAHCGRVVAPYNPDAFAESIRHYLEHPGDRIRDGENGRRFFEQHFSLDRACRAYYEVLSSVQPGPRQDVGSM